MKDLDLDRCEILVCDGKGRKDRITMSPLAWPLRSAISSPPCAPRTPPPIVLMCLANWRFTFLSIQRLRSGFGTVARVCYRSGGAVPHQDLQYEIREIPDPQGGLSLELHAEGRRVASARARAEVLGDMQRQLGVARDDVRAVLETALVSQLKHQLAKVELTPPRPDPPGGLRFVSQFTYRDFDDIAVGVVWYDVPTSTTGPEDLPSVVRNKMRFEVHSILTDQSPNAKGIVDLLK
ncbi:hypothetical protein ACSRUE_19785 [Sorangium sp. KYC3313]|uniref:hypothetical protein n=1 Tax=Sorangium sp. KYC3313 TaxID=3449740 RepID=UPI003F8B8609